MNTLNALVTGASEGLGKSFAFELAQRGIDLVLVSLPGTGLVQLAAYIEKNFAVKVVYFEADLTHTEEYTSLFSSLKARNIQVNILINNAGIGNWSRFEDQTIAFYKRQIELNVIAPVLLTKLFLEQVKKPEQSYVLNVGSLGGLFVMPKKQVYGATKSFISYFTRCLRLELSQSNVRVSLLTPGGIHTKPELLLLTESLKGVSKAAILEPEHVARAAVSGMLSGKKEIIPGRINQALVMLNALLPSVIKEMIIRARLKEVFGG
jgi:short-subunit dehydrogenase